MTTRVPENENRRRVALFGCEKLRESPHPRLKLDLGDTDSFDWYSDHDVDALNADLSAGHISTIIFLDESSLLAAAIEGRLDFQTVESRRIHVRCAAPLGGHEDDGGHPGFDLETAFEVNSIARRLQARKRQGQIAAAAIIGLIFVLAFVAWIVAA